MGYRGKVEERARARELRAQSWTLQAIADELGVAKGSVSVWVRDVDFVPTPRSRGHPAGPKHPMRLKKEAELERCRVEAEAWVRGVRAGPTFELALTMYALALYAGEGGKAEGAMIFANSDPALIRVFLRWLRTEFEIDEQRLHVGLYLHADLDLDAAVAHWSSVTGIPSQQFHKPYRAVVDESMRHNRHVFGCVRLTYADTLVHRRVMARIRAIGSAFADPG
jgi:hypothetical protein